MKKTLKLLIAVIGVTLCTGYNSVASETPTDKPVIRVTGKGASMATYFANATSRGNSVACKTTAHVGGFSFAGKWDLTDYNKVSFVIQNLDQEHMLSMVIHIQDVAKPLEQTKNKGTMRKTFVLDAGETREFVFDLPAPLPHPEVQKKFKGMYNNPYVLGYGMFVCDVDWSNVTRVKFFAKQGMSIRRSAL